MVERAAAPGARRQRAHGVGIEADGPAACARAARSQLALGVDFVKVMASGGVGVVRPGEDPTHPELTVEEMRAVVDVATAAGRPVAAHADGVQGITNSLEAGISCIEHGIYLTPDHARYMAANGVVLVPTLSTMTAIARKTEELGLPPVWKPIAEAILPVHRASFQAALDAGVTFAAGTDSYGDIVDEIMEFTTYGIYERRCDPGRHRRRCRHRAQRQVRHDRGRKGCGRDRRTGQPTGRSRGIARRATGRRARCGRAP